MRVKFTKESLMKALEDFDHRGERWIKGHYLWPEFIELDATPIDAPMEEKHEVLVVHDLIGCPRCGMGDSELRAALLAQEPCHPRHSVEETKVVPSPRIDWCGECKIEHGFECPPKLPKEIDESNDWGPRWNEIRTTINQIVRILRAHK